MTDEDKIIVKNLKKIFEFRLNREGMLRNVLEFGKKRNKILALDDVSFEIPGGMVVGILGKNGSGKSTLLRILAGIYEPSEGEVKNNGEVIYISGFNHGLNKKLSMRENIFLIGSLRGIKKSNMFELFDRIVDFSGLRDYLDIEVNKLSSGMINRLCFSITIHCISHQRPDIILIDEALGSGVDKDFKESVFKKVEELIVNGATVVIVSHNLNYIKKYCKYALFFDRGKIVKRGTPYEVVNFYKDYVEGDTNLINDGNNLISMEDIFCEIYQENYWGVGNDDFYSGTGSDASNCLPFKNYIEDYIKGNEINSVVDLGCGDFRFGGMVRWGKVSYTGVDVVGSLVQRNNKLFSKPNIRFIKKDIVEEDLPEGDLCILRLVLQHLSNKDILKIIPKLKKYKYVIVVDGTNVKNYAGEINLDIKTGRGIRDNGLFLDKAPFNLKVNEEMKYLNEDGGDIIRIFSVFP